MALEVPDPLEPLDPVEPELAAVWAAVSVPDLAVAVVVDAPLDAAWAIPAPASAPATASAAMVVRMCGRLMSSPFGCGVHRISQRHRGKPPVTCA
jgi:hypothetical protein